MIDERLLDLKETKCLSRECFQINKYVLYLVVLIVVFGAVLLPKMWCYITYERTKGRVIGYHDVHVNTRRGGYTRHYPIVQFQTPKYTVEFIAPHIMYDETRSRKLFTVIYNSDEKIESAYVLDFLGLWGTSFTYLMPFFLIWSAIMLGVGFIPKTIKVEKHLIMGFLLRRRAF